jgi:hypothetical protein
MGADLYINRIYKPKRDKWMPEFHKAVALRDAAADEQAKEQAQKLVEQAYDQMYTDDCYFRDSYNGTGVLSRLGLSWWNDLRYDLEETEDCDVNVSADACRQFLEKVRAASLESVTEESLRANHCRLDADNTVEDWRRFFEEKRQRLIAFLERAIENGGMYASC